MKINLFLYWFFLTVILSITGCTLPPGQNTGDLLYWDGADWQLTPAPPADAASTHPTLSLCNGIPTWSSTACDSELYAIGDTGPAGGVVFHITDGGLHGLEASPIVGTAGKWGCYDRLLNGANGTAIGTGAQNTGDIATECNEADIAAREAIFHSVNDFNDWYLPSKDELHLLCLQKDVVGGFANDTYLSSTQKDERVAYIESFIIGGSPPFCEEGGADKFDSQLIRFIRSF